MKKIVSGIALSLVSLLAFANDEVVAVAPQVEADPTGLIVFAVVFVGMIGGFAWYIWMKDRGHGDGSK
jgi:uncharacterized membrane-anchored protein